MPELDPIQDAFIDEIIKANTLNIIPGKTQGSRLRELIKLLRDRSEQELNKRALSSAINDKFKGKYTSLANLQSAHPTAIAGDYAQVDEGPGFEVVNYNYDLEEGWIVGSTGNSSGGATSESLKITYTGQLQKPLILTMVPGNITIPLGAVAGQATYTKEDGPAISALFYNESNFTIGNRLATISFDDLKSIGSFQIGSCLVLTSISFPALTSATGIFAPSNLAVLSTLSIPLLKSCNSDFVPTILNQLTSLTTTSLENVVGNFGPAVIANLSTMSFPALKYVGGTFSANTLGSVSTFSFPALEYVGSNFTVGFMGNLVSLLFPALTTVMGNFQPTSMSILTSMSFPVLNRINGTFNPTTFSNLTTLSFPLLAILTTGFQPTTMNSLTTLSFPALTNSGAFVPGIMANLTSMNFPELVTVAGNFQPNTMAALTTISFPALANIIGSFAPAQMGSLTTVNFPAMINITQGVNIASGTVPNVSSVTLGVIGTLKSIGGTFLTLSGLKIPSVNVNSILALLVSLDGTNGTTLWGSGKTLNINGGTNGAPTGQGLTDKVTLQARGAVVNTN